MRGIFTVVSLLIALAIVGVVAKKQLASISGGGLPSSGAAPTSDSASTTPSLPSAPKDAVLQFKQALDAAQPVKRDADEK